MLDRVETLDQFMPEILFAILLKTGDPVDLLQMQRVCRALRGKLQGRFSPSFWKLSLTRDFPNVIVTDHNANYRKLYQQQWLAREKNNHLDIYQQRLFFLIRFGNLERIKNYSFVGERSPIFSPQQNDFLDVYDKDQENAITKAIRYKRQHIIDFIYSGVSEKIFKSNEQDYRARTQLYFAALCGNLSEVLRLVSKNNVNQADHEGKTPLYVAVEQGHHEVVKALLEAEAQVDVVTIRSPKDLARAQLYNFDPRGKTPLWIAAKRGHHKVVELLTTKGANVHQKFDDATPLSIAAYEGHTEVVVALLAAGANVDAAGVNLEERSGAPALWVAANNGHIKVVKTLLAAEATVDQEWCGMTPLWRAASNGHHEIVAALLTAGANADHVHNGDTALMQAVKIGHLEVVKKFLEKKPSIKTLSNQHLLYIAAQKNYPEIVDVLLAAGINPNCIFNEVPALFEAIYLGHNQVVEKLLAAKVDANTTHTGVTPLWLACQQGHPELVKALLAAGAKVNENRGLDESTAVYIAAQTNHVDVIKVLIAAGADINKPTQGGTTPLEIACYQNNSEVIKTLVAAGADVNKHNQDGFTPLEIMCWQGNLEAIKTLLEAGANFNQMLIDLTNERDHKSVASFLRLWELKIDNKNQSICNQVITILGEPLESSTFKGPTFFKSGPEKDVSEKDLIEHLERIAPSPAANEVDLIKMIVAETIPLEDRARVFSDKLDFILRYILTDSAKQAQTLATSQNKEIESSSLKQNQRHR